MHFSFYSGLMVFVMAASNTNAVFLQNQTNMVLDQPEFSLSQTSADKTNSDLIDDLITEMGSKGTAMSDQDKKKSLTSIINQVVKNKVQAEAKRQEKANQSS